MTLPASGTIDFVAIAGEFGGSTPYKLSNYYRGGAHVLNITKNNMIPTSGTIKFSDFYSTGNEFFSLANSGVPSGAGELSNAAWNGASWVVSVDGTSSAWISHSNNNPPTSWSGLSNIVGAGSDTNRDVASVGSSFYVSVNNGGTVNPVASSTSGTSWTSIAISGWGAGGAQDIATNGSNIWVLFKGNQLATSANGTSWTNHGTVGALPNKAGGVKFVGGTLGFVTANGSSAGFYWSTNGTTWTLVTASLTSFIFSDMAFNGTTYVIVGTNGSGDFAAFHSTTPTTGWTACSIPDTGAGTIEGIDFGSSRFVYGTTGGQFASSSAGSTFTRFATVATPGTDSIEFVKYVGSFFIAGGNIQRSGNQSILWMSAADVAALPP